MQCPPGGGDGPMSVARLRERGGRAAFCGKALFSAVVDKQLISIAGK